MQMEQSIRKADMELVAKSLPDKSILIEFFRYRVFNFNAVPYSQWSDSHYCAFVLSSCQLENIKFIDLGNADMIDRLIASYKLKIMGNQQKQSSLEIMERELHDSLERVSQLLEGNAPNEKRRSRLVQVDISDRVQSDMGINKGMQLYYGLFAPIKEAFSDCSHLIIAPDSQLNMIPFEVIPIPEGGYLVDKYRISYVGVGRDVLPFSKQKPGKPEKPMVIASPDFDLSAEEKLSQSENSPSTRRFSENFTNEFSKFYPLPGTKLEGEYIGKLLGIKPLLEKEALEARIKSVSSPQILHIATHGFFLNDIERRSLEDPPGIRDEMIMGMPHPDESKENPMLLSGFVMAGVNTWLRNGALPPEAEDGIVTAEDVTGLDLTNTDLVVLSACETGIGEVKVAEGVFGLRRAFTLAGAKTLIMSLWKVNDICTQELMEDFYRRILAGTPKADALRDAQIKLREKYPHPRDWGAFICQGDPGPLSMDNTPQ
jgi:CHAT domain-containing protein